MTRITSEGDGIKAAATAGGLDLSSTATYAVISFKHKDSHDISHTHSTKREFQEGSEQAGFCRAFDGSLRFTVYLDISQQYNSRCFKAYQFLVESVRKCTIGNQPQANWWAARDPRFHPGAASQYYEFVENPYATFPIQPWLEQKNGLVASVYMVEGMVLPRTTFPSMLAWLNHEIPALLMERDQRNCAVHSIYNRNKAHSAIFEKINGDDYLIHVKLIEELEQGTRVLPSTGAIVYIYMFDMPDLDHQNIAFRTVVGEDPRTGFDLIVRGSRPHLLNTFNPEEQAYYQVAIQYTGESLDLTRRIAAIEETFLRSTWASLHSQHAKMIVGGKNRGIFCLDSIICGKKLKYDSHDFAASFLALGTKKETVCLFLDARWRCRSVLDSEQNNFIDAALAGVPVCFAMLVGISGSGKTRTMAWLMILFLIMEVRVVGYALSSTGVGEPFLALETILHADPTTRHLLPRIVHFNTAAIERMTEDVGESFKEPYIGGERSPDDVDLIVCTTEVANGLVQKLCFKPEVVLLDEASQLTTVDVASVIVKQTLKLLLLAGDVQQLGPVSGSNTARKNPLGNLLVLSSLERILFAYPYLTSFTLTENYRSHADTWHMANKIFYKGKMTSGQGIKRNTDVTRKVQGLLTSGSFQKVSASACLSLSNPEKRTFLFDALGKTIKSEHASSWRNPNGIAALIKFIKALVKFGDQASEISIISMYQDDVSAIKDNLRAADLLDIEDGIEVSTVDAFQGRQKAIILMHFVAAFDAPDPWGVVSHPNRLCVGTTRAQEYFFMFGNWTLWESKLGSGSKLRRGRAKEKMVALHEYVRETGRIISWKDVSL